MSHVVKYYESERGWGGEVWFRRFPTKADADAEIAECNAEYEGKPDAPDYYIIASYVGVDSDEFPDSKYDGVYKHG